MPYCEFLAATAFSFLEGASSPEALVGAAKAVGHQAVGVADVNSVAGVVRGFLAAREAKIRFLAGCRLKLRDAPDLVCYPADGAAWGRLCRM